MVFAILRSGTKFGFFVRQLSSRTCNFNVEISTLLSNWKLKNKITHFKCFLSLWPESLETRLYVSGPASHFLEQEMEARKTLQWRDIEALWSSVLWWPHLSQLTPSWCKYIQSISTTAPCRNALTENWSSRRRNRQSWLWRTSQSRSSCSRFPFTLKLRLRI